jgi:methionine-rich copper-binding protein CopC
MGKSESMMWRLAKLPDVGAAAAHIEMRHPENRGAKVAIVSVIRSNNNLMKTLQTNSNKSKNDIVRVKSNVNLGSRIFLRNILL